MELKFLQSFLCAYLNFTSYEIDPREFLTMRFSTSIFAGFASLAAAAPSALGARDLTSFIAQERAIALQGVKNNIGPDGSKAPGAGAGFVVASPSRVDPPCKSSVLTTTKKFGGKVRIPRDPC